MEVVPDGCATEAARSRIYQQTAIRSKIEEACKKSPTGLELKERVTEKKWQIRFNARTSHIQYH
jgi:hypothetical protein